MNQRVRTESAALRLGVEPATLAAWRRRRVGPPFYRLGHAVVVYDVAELERWLAERRVPRGRGPRGNVSIEA